MKNITLTLGLLAILAAGAAAQDDPAPGERVEITFASGATLKGTVVKPTTPPREPGLTLDLTWEYPGLNGTLTVPTQDIRGLRKLEALDAEALRKVTELKRKMAQDQASTPATTKPPAPTAVKPAPKPEEPKAKGDEELQKALEIYAKFPEPDWSPERRNAIRLKQYRGQVPTPQEREFLAGYDLWEKGRAEAKKK